MAYVAWFSEIILVLHITLIRSCLLVVLVVTWILLGNYLTMEEAAVINAEIDIRSAFTPFDYPSLTEVIQAIEKQLPEDRLKIVKQMRGPLLGLYKITSTNYELYKDKYITVRKVKLPVILRRKTPRVEGERIGTLVTIYDAFTGPAQQVPGTSFNEYFAQIPGAKVIKQTTPQFYKDTRILNGNRYLVIDFDKENVDLGESLHIGNFQFKINFYGQKRFCYLCQARHGAICPEKVKFQEMAAAREGKLTHKIYADSTLRKVNQLALAADVACTSGAGIGQIVNLIEQDPIKMDNIVILAGGNEIRQTDDEQMFQHQVNEAGKKLHQLSANRNITLVLPPTPRATLAEEVKYEVMKEVFGSLKSITVLELPTGVVPYEGIHPTTEGTAALIGLLEKHLEADLILAREYVSTDRNYSQVHSYFKFGCRTCDSRDYTPIMCGKCVEQSKAVDTSRLFALAKEIYERDNPPLDNDSDMKEIMKRGFLATTAINDENAEIGNAGKKAKVVNDV